MSRGRYSTRQLQYMARAFIQAERLGDPRAQLLILMLPVRTGLSASVVRGEIASLAGEGC